MKKFALLLFVSTSMALSSAPVLAGSSQTYWVDSMNEAESMAGGLARCKKQAKHPNLCRLAKVMRGSNGSYRAVYVAN
ncbi:hypothetical protein [Cohaesibacter celericrescens]|uniref:hypothetical protein n=1 Tax=Cohaesibacter celericrescens TaxID=2067669 RepID=UPI00356AF8C0